MALGTTTTWNGSAEDGDWGNASNWSNGIPVQTGVATGTAVIDGDEDITGGNPTGHTLDNVFIASTYTGAIGSNGTPLELDFKELNVNNSASGSTHYIDKHTGSNTGVVSISGTKTGNALYLSGTIEKIIVEADFVGTVILGNSASFVCEPKDLVVMTTSGTCDASSSANVEWENSSTIDVLSGTLLLGENIGQDSTMTVSGGTVTVSGWTVETGDTINMHSGVLNWDAGSSGLGNVTTQTTVTNLNIFGGTVTTASNETAYVGWENIKQYGGTLNFRSNFANSVVTNTYNSYAGIFTPTKQSVITVAAK